MFINRAIGTVLKTTHFQLLELVCIAVSERVERPNTHNSIESSTLVLPEGTMHSSPWHGVLASSCNLLVQIGANQMHQRLGLLLYRQYDEASDLLVALQGW